MNSFAHSTEIEIKIKKTLLDLSHFSRATGDLALALGYFHLAEIIGRPNEEISLRNRETSPQFRDGFEPMDLIIDKQLFTVRTLEGRRINLGRQFVLMDILETLASPWQSTDNKTRTGFTKGEIVERVWKEPYRPEFQDNKLYYNINRLRKLIEPEMQTPRYILGIKGGYRLAPGLKVQVL